MILWIWQIDKRWLKPFSKTWISCFPFWYFSMKNAYKRIQAPKNTFLKIALNRLLTLPDYSTGLELLISSGIIDFENKNISVVTKHWKYRISVPMLYITFKIDKFSTLLIDQSISYWVEKFDKFYTKSKKSIKFVLSRKIHVFKDRFKSPFDTATR